MKCPFCECDLLLEAKTFSSKDKDWLPKTRYLQAYVKYLKIVKLSKKYRLKDSGRIQDLLKDCLNDMDMALELKFGKRFLKHWKFCPKKQHLNGSWKNRWDSRKRSPNRFWDCWMHELAEIRNHAIHGMPAFRTVKDFGVTTITTTYYLRAETQNGKITETNEEVLPYLKKTLEKIKEKLEITEI
jgi:hypothetical protein